MDFSYNKNLEKHNVLYNINNCDGCNNSLNEEEALYIIYERILTNINKIIDDVLAIKGTSLIIFKEYISNLNILAQRYSKDILITMSNIVILQNKYKNEEIESLTKIWTTIRKKELDIITMCIRDGYMKKYNCLIIATLIDVFLAEIAKGYISSSKSNFTEKINSFLFDILLIKDKVEDTKIV